MSVIWVNFLGYMFEVPAIIFMTLKQWDKSFDKSITFKNKKDWSLFIFWFSIYVYCIATLFKLNIMSANFLYAFFTFFIMIMTLVLSLIDIENNH